MSHLRFDLRDWRFILDEWLDAARLLEHERLSAFDKATCDRIVEQIVKAAVDDLAAINVPGDREGCELVDGRVRTPAGYAGAWKTLVELGWMLATKGPRFGGMGLPEIFATPCGEAINAASQALYLYQGLTTEAALLIETFASDELAETFVPPMYGGSWGGTMCLTEAEAGSAVGELVTRAAPNDDGSYDIRGSKIFITGGDTDFYENVVHLVLARIEGDPEGTKGVSLFIVPKYLPAPRGGVGDFNHVTVDGLERKLGIHASATCTVGFGREGPCRGFLVGERCAGITYMFQMMNHARFAVGLQATSLANAAYQQALAWAKERRQGPDLADPAGGSAAIVAHPDVRRNLMFMKAWAEGTRALVAQAALWEDLRHYARDAAEAVRAGDLLDLVTPIVKACSADRAFEVTERAIQVFGGYGYTQDYPVEQYLRDCKILSIYEGTNGIQALDLLGRKMRQKGGGLFATYAGELGAFVEAHRDEEAVAGVIAALAAAREELAKVAFWLASRARDDLRLALQQATPFLELFGDVLVGHMLAQQAAVAAKALAGRIGSAAPTREQRERDAEVAFYAGKLDTARFFATEVLLQAPARARSMTSGDTSALDMVF